MIYLIGLIIILSLAFMIISIHRFYTEKYMYRVTVKNIYSREDDKLYQMISKIRFLNRSITKLAYSTSVFNYKSIEENFKIATNIVMTFIFLTPIVLLVSIIVSELWYIALTYFLIFLLVIFLITIGFETYAQTKFSSYLPMLFKITNQRLSTNNNIVNVLDVCKKNVKKPLKRTITKLVDIIEKNSRQDVEKTFYDLSVNYKNDLFTIYLLLIEQAAYGGVSKEVIEQFQIQNRKIEIKNAYIKNINSNANVWIFTFIILVLIMLYVFNPMTTNMLKEFTGQEVDTTLMRYKIYRMFIYLGLLTSLIVMTFTKRID